MKTMTIKQIAAAAGITTATLYKMERGEAAPNLGTMDRIANALNMSLTGIIAAGEEN